MRISVVDWRMGAFLCVAPGLNPSQETMLQSRALQSSCIARLFRVGCECISPPRAEYCRAKVSRSGFALRPWSRHFSHFS
jgi:hypothetical protein